MFHIGIATQHPPLPNANEMSEIGIDFLQACVTLDPTERPSATELIEHPWLAHLTEGGVSLFDLDWTIKRITADFRYRKMRQQ